MLLLPLLKESRYNLLRGKKGNQHFQHSSVISLEPNRVSQNIHGHAYLAEGENETRMISFPASHS